MVANGSNADARVHDRASRDDSAFDLVDVPAAVVCAACGDPDCPGCSIDERTNQSGVIAIVPWERADLGFWRKLWQTATLTTVHARTFFGVVPDGELSSALSFALVCETLAVGGLGFGAALLAVLFVPELPALLAADAALRGKLLRGGLVAFAGLVFAMVLLHAAHGLALDAAARRHGGRSRGRGLRFGLYACGWDLVTLPLGLLVMAVSSGLGAARRAAPLGLTAPRHASESYLMSMHGLGADAARHAGRRAAYLTAIPVVSMLVFGGALIMLALR